MPQEAKTQSLHFFEQGFLFADIKMTFAVLFAVGAFFLIPVSSDIGLLSLKADLYGNGTSTPVFQGSGIQGGAELVRQEIQGSELGIVEEGSLIQTILFIIRYILIFSGLLAFVAFLWAGFLYVTAFARDENTESAKNAMLYASIGIIIILFSWVIVEFLTTFSLNGG